MADTFGSLIDKLITVDMKLWYSQELVYEIRRMTYEQFKEKYFDNEEGFKKFFTSLNKATELNYQRNLLVDELDEKLLEMLLETQKSTDLNDKGYVRKSLKTY